MRMATTALQREGSLPVWMPQDSRAPTREETLEWLAGHVHDIEATLDREGGVVLRGLTCLADADAFDEAISVVAPHQHDYVGGTSPRTVVRRKVMTATDTPPGWSIALHQEMAYTARPPDRIAFFSEQPAAHGGQTTIADMRKVLGRIPRGFRDLCERHGLQLRRAIPSPENAHLKPGFQKPWTEVFATQDKREVDRIVGEKGWQAQWQADGEILHVWQDLVPPVRRHPVTGEYAWSNFAHFFSPVCMMAWALQDGRVDEYEALAHARRHNPQMLDTMVLGNGDPVPEADALHVYRILHEAEHPAALLPSDIMILDNIHYAHGRRAFSGPRSVLVSLFDRLH
ncbi:TauD/TfdA family dioxygenase [Verticiella sediminum]|nr:TauD/TfdA family dioxygenase [Verticiella sediminum]